MNKTVEQIAAEIIGELRLSYTGTEKIARQVIEGIRETYRIEQKGTPIEPKDVRHGDLVRIEYDNGNATKKIIKHELFVTTVGRTIYLLDRPDPDESFVFPNRDGAVIRLTPKGGEDRTVASRELGNWYIAGIERPNKEEHLRKYYCNFEVLSDGSDQ